eukprot:5375764-Karenia_brevis.AAC.1
MTPLRMIEKIFMATVAQCRVGLVNATAQVWPTEMCRRLDASIRNVSSHRASTTAAFSAIDASIGCA